MKPIEITLNLGKIDKNRITTRTYKDKEGNNVSVKEYKITVVPTKEPKLITQKDDWRLLKTHFVVEKRDKDEDKNYVGEGFTFERNEEQQSIPNEEIADDINPEDVPF